MRSIPLIMLLLLTTGLELVRGQSTCPPPNIGFESGTFNNWQCDTGRIDPAGNLHLASSNGPVDFVHTIIDKNTADKTDEYGGFPTLCPYGGGHSAKLGNVQGGAIAEGLSYTFTIPAGADHYNFIYYYAAVMKDAPGTHTGTSRPRMRIKIFDITDNKYLDCPGLDVYVITYLPGWKIESPASPILPADRVYYKDWTTEAVNLGHYAGKQLRIEFTVNADTHRDRDGGGSFGYAYVDINEDCASPINGNAYCNGQNTITMAAPPGVNGYQWYKADDFGKQLGNTPILTVPSPPDLTRYAVVLASQCPDTVYTTVRKSEAGFVFKTLDTLYRCPSASADLTRLEVTAGSSSGLTFTYYTDASLLSYVPDPTNITENGTYFIRANNAEGCSNILPVVVITIDPNVIHVVTPPAVVFPATVDLTKTFDHTDRFTYNYYTDQAGTLPVFDPYRISESAKYFIQARSKDTGCSAIAEVDIIISPPIPPIIKAPNIFTPNNDGINDQFSIIIVGYDTFRSLKIFDRYGQMIFESEAADVAWDGTFNHRPCNVGTYYWIFEGTDQYYRKTVHQSGPITLIR